MNINIHPSYVNIGRLNIVVNSLIDINTINGFTAFTAIMGWLPIACNWALYLAVFVSSLGAINSKVPWDTVIMMNQNNISIRAVWLHHKWWCTVMVSEYLCASVWHQLAICVYEVFSLEFKIYFLIYLNCMIQPNINRKYFCHRNNWFVDIALRSLNFECSNWTNQATVIIIDEHDEEFQTLIGN